MSASTLDTILQQHRDAAVVNVDEPEQKLVIFALGEDWFAFPGHCIREILANVPVFPVPGCPASLEGVINVRGNIESVVSIEALLQLPQPAQRDESLILLGHASTMHSGIRVQRVVDVVDLPVSSIQPAPADLPDARRAHCLGVLAFNAHPVLVLDLEALFSAYAGGLG